MPLKYPFGPVPAVEARISLQYDEHWQREVVITWQQDDGLGLNLEELKESIFWDKFQEAKNTVESEQGIFHYKPYPGKGHTLTIRYPKLDLYAIGEKASFDEPMKLLVIDNDQNFIDQVYDAYTPKGCIVHEATNSQTGLEIFSKEKIHLSIVDEHMPGSLINGAETIRKIREMDPQGCCIMTTRSEEDNVSQAQARRLGVIAYYVKPLNMQRINFSITETKGFFKLRDEVKQWSTL
jgi:CheY-like chemotaxis protein